MKPFEPAIIACALLIGSTLLASSPDARPPKLVEVQYGQTTTTYSPAPKYPHKEREAHASGIATVVATVAADGSVTDIKIAKSQPTASFGIAAAAAVSQWKFEPKTKTGQRAPFVVSIPLYFMDATD